VYRGRVRVHAVQRLLLQRCNLVGVTCSIRRSRRTSSRNCTVSEPEREGERGGRESNVCAPGSSIQRHLCSREQNQAVFVLPGAQSSDTCAPGSTIKPYLCSREHIPAMLVLPGAQSNDTCAPGRGDRERQRESPNKARVMSAQPA
jgi:hypothetical protein